MNIRELWENLHPRSEWGWMPLEYPFSLPLLASFAV